MQRVFHHLLPALATLLLAALLVVGGVAAAQEPPPDEPAIPHGAEHQRPVPEEAGVHETAYVAFTADRTGTGIPDWRDPASDYFVILPLFQHLVNLFILLAVIYFAARGPVKDALLNRAHGIRKELTESARMRDEARQRHEDLAARLSGFEDELTRMRADAQREADAEEAKLIERAEEASRRILETADRNIRDEVVRAQLTLRNEAVDLAVQLAEQTLRGQVQTDDQRRLARQFLDSINREEVNGG